METKRVTDSKNISEKEIYMDHRNEDRICPIKKALYIQKRNKIQREINTIRKGVFVL